MKTINLQGKQYAPVSARVEQFHKDHQDGNIRTEVTFVGEQVVVKAQVMFGERDFTGHAFGNTKSAKAFEKLETTAVGRALAFAGYLAGGEIASYDEMQEFVNSEMTDKEAMDKLRTATTFDELKEIFMSLPKNLQTDPEVVAVKDELKTELID